MSPQEKVIVQKIIELARRPRLSFEGNSSKALVNADLDSLCKQLEAPEEGPYKPGMSLVNKLTGRIARVLSVNQDACRLELGLRVEIAFGINELKNNWQIREINYGTAQVEADPMPPVNKGRPQAGPTKGKIAPTPDELTQTWETLDDSAVFSKPPSSFLSGS